MQQTTQTPQPAQAAKPRPAPPKPPAEFVEGDIATMDGAGLARILGDPAASEFRKAKACQRAGEIGAQEAVPALAALLNNEHLSTYARYGLEPIADASAGEALRAALPKLKGIELAGVINSLAKRRDEKAVPALNKLVNDGDVNVSRAAIAALGSIGSAGSAKDLQNLVAKNTGLTKMAAADACLLWVERALERGERDAALKMYAFLSAADMPKPARLGAMNGIIREETSPGRPR